MLVVLLPQTKDDFLLGGVLQHFQGIVAQQFGELGHLLLDFYGWGRLLGVDEAQEELGFGVCQGPPD